jgi:hypothetical protein
MVVQTYERVYMVYKVIKQAIDEKVKGILWIYS